jgi:hypothetical protein
MNTEVLTTFTEMLAGLSSVEEAPALPLPSVPATRTAWAYPLPGTAVPDAHRGRSGGLVTKNTDDIIVEWHLKVNPDQIAVFLSEAPAVLEEFRNAIWKLGTPSLGIVSIAVPRFGQLGWGNDFTYGFRLRVGVVHWSEVS